MSSSDSSMTIGVLALQGAFAEHIDCLKKLGVSTVQIRNPDELTKIDGLVIPGGESSTISLVAEEWKLIEPLQKWITENRPIFGTCAGMIFIAKDAHNQKKNGQKLLGKLNIVVDRNHFGRQKFSFECNVKTDIDQKKHSGIFIRAPGILDVGEGVSVLGTIEHGEKKDMAVAVRQDSLLATCFHPELTEDLAWHAYFLKMVKDAKMSKFEL
eukprot:CAMPEP_0197518856 /NCGR_PEP_ID=MMETSP1318-20131121/4106_1 /TAXON_ID=552666 /ORGANISM="Partenskyella glossopodia, Strain RCC365" /LENGTH=211 /DNA_ID=CAMNT_0043069511 /DNA_START=51 /DNA_END=686 /DNA_ORIENTATION=-